MRGKGATLKHYSYAVLFHLGHDQFLPWTLGQYLCFCLLDLRAETKPTANSQQTSPEVSPIIKVVVYNELKFWSLE